MTRHTDWQARLDAYLLDHQARPFNWLSNNCTTFAAGWIELATGQVMHVPKTATAKTAARTVARLGGLLKDARRQLGQEIPGNFAQCGDVVLLTVADAKAFGVCIGASVAAQGPDGLVLVPITQAEAAWRV